MAQHGARHIIVSNRSGISDDASARVMDSCRFHGCEVTEAKGDIGSIQFVGRMFKTASPRIAGIIQGAMVLRVSFQNLERCTENYAHRVRVGQAFGNDVPR